MALPGWVSNSSQGVFVEVEGAPEVLRTFLLRLEKERPPRSSIQSIESSFLTPLGLDTFEIRPERWDWRAHGPYPSGYRHLRRLPSRDLRRHRPALPLPVHQLHQLRSPFLDHPILAVRPTEYHHGPFHHVWGLRSGVPKSGRP